MTLDDDLAAEEAHEPFERSDDVATLLARIKILEGALTAATSMDADAVIELNDQRVLQDAGIYRYHHPLEDAAGYKDRLRELNTAIDQKVKAGDAIVAADMFESHWV